MTDLVSPRNGSLGYQAKATTALEDVTMPWLRDLELVRNK